MSDGDDPAGQESARSVRDGGSADSRARDLVRDIAHVTYLEATLSIRG